MYDVVFVFILPFALNRQVFDEISTPRMAWSIFISARMTVPYRGVRLYTAGTVAEDLDPRLGDPIPQAALFATIVTRIQTAAWASLVLCSLPISVDRD
ncbi:hypothetical protein CC1G_15198 [Coprinopsis cinerea okayama7|uniref:Uncharacterized protein n=1 Tax=Coprinopsis cinerea (strain Okayama-7 / 130 / ATCC MYA-4618 / FGSC 9003) TaxID=240176 RepID=D6RPR2_COPC7|nr:hypothetical protein CC1G_15198 [Coprinopsis cinerea okayama7\|eukprot:XP_002910563.1 hypothetical protein CC1G_15198 [Coprinopsis cinerea okayama7\